MRNVVSQNEICLIIPRWNSSRYSLGIMYISSYLTNKGYNNTILDSSLLNGKEYSRELAEKEILSWIENRKPRVVGFTCTAMETSEVINLNKKIKHLDPKIITIVGGPHPTNLPREFILNGIDFVVRGEGEETTLELIQTIFNGGNFSKIEGISYQENGEIRNNPARPYISNLDSIPFPAFDKINMKQYTAMQKGIIRGVPLKAVLVFSSRGCPYNCSFCGCNTVFGRTIRFRSAENIYQEIKLLRDNYGVEGIWFADDTLTVNRGHVRAICEVMENLGMLWGCQARVNTIDEDLLMEMKKSGCLQLDFGVESGSERILRDIANKKISINGVKTAFSLCKRVGIRTMASFIFGFPTETREDMKATFSLAKEIDADWYGVYILTPLPGTKIWDMIIDDDISYELYSNLSFGLINSNNEIFNKTEVGLDDLNELYTQYKNCLNTMVRRKVFTFKNLLYYTKILFSRRNKLDRTVFYTKSAIRDLKRLLN